MVTDTVFTGTSVAVHNDLGGLNDGDYKHLTASEYGSTILDRAVPGNIGGTTPASGAFTELTITSKTPTTSSGTGNQGDICWDINYMYVCVSTDTWKRAALTTW